MNFSAVIHQAKSEYAYAYGPDTLHFRIKTAKGDVGQVELLAIDPFNWVPRNDGTLVYDLDKSSLIRVNMEKEQETEYHDCWFAEVCGIVSKRTKYCFIAANENEKYIIGCHDCVPYTDDDDVLYNLFNYFNFPYINEEDLYQAPKWVAGTVWYQIFPDRFCNGTPNDARNILPWGSDGLDGAGKKFGGNLEGIIDKLDYIKQIGCDGIYLTPVFKARSSHKYDTEDYYTIDPEFGDNETMGRLVEAAHKRGIKVMLDAVFNHCGYYHPFWQDVLENGKDSKYYDCFYILDSEKPVFDGEVIDGEPQAIPRQRLNYRTFAYTPAMPKWNTGNPIVREYLMKAACFWIEKYHIDGWRLDVSNEVSHSFWREFRTRVKALNPDVYIVGENWDNSYPWLRGDQFDAVMNYEFAMPVWKYFEDSADAYTEQQFKNAIGKLLTAYPKNVTQNLFNLLESHDTERIMNRISGRTALAKLAYLFMFTFPGSPCLYYGGEIGMNGGEHSNRQCMYWDKSKQNMELFTFIQKLAALRKEHESFRTTEFQWLASGRNSSVLAYKKTAKEEILYVLFQKGEQDVTYTLPEEMRGKKGTDAVSGKEMRLDRQIILEKYGYFVFICKMQ